MLISSKHPIILASSSKIRAKIMKQVELNFETHSPDFDEEAAKKIHKGSIRQLAITLAEGKALSISKKFPDSYVIGSDQVCEFSRKAISKSNNKEEAIAQLTKMNGSNHYQNNATVIALNGKIIFRNFSRVKMTMRQLTKQEIEQYVEIEKPWGCAGSYKYESLGKHLFKKTSGDYFSILGLSIQPILHFLHRQKIIKFNS